jgi:AP-1 complex subunit beta-1
VYHKPPSTFVGQGRFGADAIQHAAIQEQMQNAAENPIAAVVAAGTNGQPLHATSGAENLLDIDFDGAAPASADAPPATGTSGLEGLAGTPQRVASPAAPGGNGSAMDDIMGLFDGSSSAAQAPPAAGGGGMDDLINGFGDMDFSGGNKPPPPQQQLGGGGGKKTTEDLLGMF